MENKLETQIENDNDEKEQEEEEIEEQNVELVEEKEQVYPKIKSKIEILDILFHPTETNLITLGLINGKLKIYDLNKTQKRLVSAKKLHKKSIRKIAHPVNNSDLIFTASKDKSIQLNDIKHEANILTIEKAHKAPINCMKVIDNWLIATADDNGCIKIWDYRRKTASMESNEDCADYISDLAVSKDTKTLLATCGEGTLTAFHTRKKKMIMQSELMDSELLCVAFVKNDNNVICGSGEGVINIFNNGEYGNILDRFPGHPSSIDCMLPITRNIVLTGCFDGNIRACSIFPNRFLGILGNHDGFPIQSMSLSSDTNVVASISHDECVKFWNVENIKTIKIENEKKKKSKSLKNKKINVHGKSDNFFADLCESKEDDDSDEDDDDDEDDDSDNDEDSDSSNDSD